MDADVVVIGGGVMGLAAAWRLAVAGVPAMLLEASAFGGPAGGSHGATRIFRLAYGHPDYVALARAALPLWRELEDGSELLRITGGLDVGDPGSLGTCADALADAGAAHEWMDARAVRDAFGWIDVADDARALYSPDAGVIAAARTIDALADRARAAGATVREEARVSTIEPDGDAVVLGTNSETIRARRCIVAAGAWANALLEPIGIRLPLRVTREQVVFFDAPDATIPVIERGDGFRYLVPEMFGAPGSKMGDHMSGPEVDPRARGFDEDPAITSRLRDWTRARFPTFGHEPVGFETCLYTTTPDEDFVIGARGPVIVASPCSGHGFKFAPLIGEALACLATGREPPLGLDRFRLERF